MGRWFRVASIETIPPGTGRTVRVDGMFVALFNDRGEIHAIDDACPHQGASLGEGFLHAGTVVCPWHNWMFEVRTGKCPRVPHISVASYPTRRVGDAIEVELPDRPDAPPGSNS